MLTYDGLGRRIVKAVENSGDWNATHHYYYNGQSMIETRNGSDQVTRQYVWGTQYIDELVQVGLNQDPQNASSSPPEQRENVCERFFWPVQDANYNVVAALRNDGSVAERYEYTPYGRRTVYSHGWIPSDFNDDGYLDGTDASILANEYNFHSTDADNRCDLSGDGVINGTDYSIFADEQNGTAVDRPGNDPEVDLPVMAWACNTNYAGNDVRICDFGHQGLLHDREFDLWYNRARYLNSRTATLQGRDALGYKDGMNLHQPYGSNPVTRRDPSGNSAIGYDDMERYDRNEMMKKALEEEAARKPIDVPILVGDRNVEIKPTPPAPANPTKDESEKELDRLKAAAVADKMRRARENGFNEEPITWNVGGGSMPVEASQANQHNWAVMDAIRNGERPTGFEQGYDAKIGFRFITITKAADLSEPPTFVLVLEEGLWLTGGKAAHWGGKGVRFVLRKLLGGRAGVTVGVRQQYVEAVSGLANKASAMRQAGLSSEHIARALHAERRLLGEQFKALTPPEKLAEIYQRNIGKYGDPLGPSIDWLRGQGKAWEQIIESASRTGGADLGF